MLMTSSVMFDFKSALQHESTFVFPAWPNFKKFKKDAPCQAFKNQERHRLKGESSPSQRLKGESSPIEGLRELRSGGLGE
ncbi:hypothetical protein Tco_0050829 [Tanacetum coccineum]